MKRSPNPPSDVMPRKKAPSDQPTTPAADPTDDPTEPTEAVKPMMKSQAMDAAIAAGASSPSDAVAYVQEHFGMEISAKQFSTHRSLAKQKASIDARHKAPKPATPPPTPKPAAAPVATPAAPAAAAAKGGPPEVADAVQAIKQLVDTLGVEQVRRIAGDRKSTRLNSSHSTLSRMPSSA